MDPGFDFLTRFCPFSLVTEYSSAVQGCEHRHRGSEMRAGLNVIVECLLYNQFYEARRGLD
jgi:hypothetical protein